MSIARKRTFVKYGITSKKTIRFYRKYIYQFPKCNKLFAFGNIAYNVGARFDMIFVPSLIN